jgi:nucleoside-diphosphate-sugar epimerase
LAIQKKTILITGSSGFIGKNIAEFLKDEYFILNPGHKDLDLLSQKNTRIFFKNNDVDIVIHCANVGGTRRNFDAGGIIESNTRMFFNLVENTDHFQKFIHMGSGAEYDKQSSLQNVRESELGVKIPSDGYGFSKYIISKCIENSENMYCLRLFGIFGKYEDYRFKFISNAIVKNLFHLPITIRQNVYFSWLDINDFLTILTYFLNNTPKYCSYNVTPPNAVDILSIAKQINAVSDFKSEIFVENEGLNLEYSGDNSRLMDEIRNLNFTPVIESLTGLVEYYKVILPTINKETITQDMYLKFCKINRP